MHIRSHTAVILGKLSARLLRLAGSGAGAFPGLIAERIAPTLLTDLADQASDGITLICGTNGKTTTSRMLSTLLPTPLIHNRSGSNLTRGHLAAFLEQTNYSGLVRAKRAILEVDEAVLPRALLLTKPRLIILHNLFRDQLDRYGEIDSIANKWLAALKKDLPTNCTVLVNADDPNLAWLASQLPTDRVKYYGLDDHQVGTTTPTATVDAVLSPASHLPLRYTTYYLSHLGEYTDNQGFSRPKLDFAAQDIRAEETAGYRFDLRTSENYPLSLSLPGLYNLYNGLAASGAALLLGVPITTIHEKLVQFKTAFGRFERLTYQEKELTLCLIKNPAGASEVLRTVVTDKTPFNLLLSANDNFADGQDVSWYWDTPYELLSNKPTAITCCGTRAADLALRLKYAGHFESCQVIEDISKAFDQVVSNSPGRTYLLSTYTASLELQNVLRRKGIKAAYWEE